ncbi:MAG: hypothetical protein IPH11_00780 [Ignavibacteriales bacterium]|nr:hypothetical protein [Ignavibacteriales bacterium]
MSEKKVLSKAKIKNDIFLSNIFLVSKFKIIATTRNVANPPGSKKGPALRGGIQFNQ